MSQTQYINYIEHTHSNKINKLSKALVFAVLTSSLTFSSLQVAASPNQCLSKYTSNYNSKSNGLKVLTASKSEKPKIFQSERTLLVELEGKNQGRTTLQMLNGSNKIINWLVNFLANNSIGRIMRLPEVSKNIKAFINDKSSDHFYVRFSRAMGFVYSESILKEIELKIPKTGPVVIVLNHPLNASETAALAAAISTIRPDIKIALTRMIENIPGIKDHSITLDPNGGPEARKYNALQYDKIDSHLANQGVLIIHPSAEVSYKENLIDQHSRDVYWKVGIANILEKNPNAQVVSVFADGLASDWYYKVKKIKNRTLSDLLASVYHIPEMLLNRNRIIDFAFSKPVKGETLVKKFKKEGASVLEKSEKLALAEYLRAKTYALTARYGKTEEQRLLLPVPEIKKNSESLSEIAEIRSFYNYEIKSPTGNIHMKTILIDGSSNAAKAKKLYSEIKLSDYPSVLELNREFGSILHLLQTLDIFVSEAPVDILSRTFDHIDLTKLNKKQIEVFKILKVANELGLGNTFYEIGRIRENNFRLMNEGSGNYLDLDYYDLIYDHKIQYSANDGLIYGFYRIGRGDKLIEIEGGEKNFYANQLFRTLSGSTEKIKEKLGLEKRIEYYTLELGRSAVNAFDMPDKKRAIKVLDGLFRGIGQFISENPQYRFLVGPVSIPGDMSKVSMKIMTEYLMQNHGVSPELMLNPVTPVVLKTNYDKEIAVLVKSLSASSDTEKQSTLAELSTLIPSIENNSNFPTLIKTYGGFGAEYRGFNLDSDFGSVDGSIIVDLYKQRNNPLTRKGIEDKMSAESYQKLVDYWDIIAAEKK